MIPPRYSRGERDLTRRVAAPPRSGESTGAASRHRASRALQRRGGATEESRYAKYARPCCCPTFNQPRDADACGGVSRRHGPARSRTGRSGPPAQRRSGVRPKPTLRLSVRGERYAGRRTGPPCSGGQRDLVQRQLTRQRVRRRLKLHGCTDQTASPTRPGKTARGTGDVTGRYDLNLWIGDSFGGATYLPR
jgi:hypothetical protein